MGREKITGWKPDWSETLGMRCPKCLGQNFFAGMRLRLLPSVALSNQRGEDVVAEQPGLVCWKCKAFYVNSGELEVMRGLEGLKNEEGH